MSSDSSDNNIEETVGPNPANYFPAQTIGLFEDYNRFPDPPTPTSIDKPISYDDIEIQEEIGAGGFGVVCRGTIEGAEVAVKQPRNGGQNPEANFNQEAEFWEGLTSPGAAPFIVNLHGWGDDPHPWICAEYVSDGTLDEYIEQYVREHNTPPPVDIALWMGITIACAVEYAHNKGVTHRDLKPNNILVEKTTYSSVPYPKLTDWGLAGIPVFIQNDEQLFTRYAAPEQVQSQQNELDQQEQGHEVDIYQVGLIVHFLLTGRHPIDAQSEMKVYQQILRGDIPLPSDRNRTIPEGLDQIIMKAVAQDTTNRYQNISKFREALEGAFRTYVNASDARVDAVDYRRSAATNTSVTETDAATSLDVADSWEVNLGTPSVHSPLAVGNRVYLPLEQRIVVLDQQDGTHVQTFDFGLPAVDDQLAGISIKRQQIYATTVSGQLISVGDERFIVSRDELHQDIVTDRPERDRRIIAPPIILPGREPSFIIITELENADWSEIYRIAADGTREWGVTIGQTLDTPQPAYQPEQGQLWIVSNDQIARVDIESGTKNFYQVDVSPQTHPVAHQDHIYYGAENAESEKLVVGMSTDEVGTDWQTTLETTASLTGLAVDEQEIVVSTAGTPANHGRIVSVHRSEGHIRWKQTFGNASVSPPSLDEQHVHVSLYFDQEEHAQYLRETGKILDEKTDTDVITAEQLPDTIENIRSLRRETGKIAFQSDTSGDVQTRILPRDGQLITVTETADCVGLHLG